MERGEGMTDRVYIKGHCTVMKCFTFTVDLLQYLTVFHSNFEILLIFYTTKNSNQLCS